MRSMTVKPATRLLVARGSLLVARCSLFVVMVVALVGCRRGAQPDAYGNVEATEIVVGSEVGGRLITFDVVEGQRLGASAIVATIDPTQLSLERDQLTAQRAASTSKVDEVTRQIHMLTAQRDAAAAERDAARAQRGALAAQLEIANRAYDRAKRLTSEQAVTSQQLDQAERDVRVLQEQTRAQDAQIAAREHQVAAQVEQIDATRALRETSARQVVAIDAQIAQVGDRLRRTDVRNPSAGTVLATYTNAGEIVQNGQPLYRIADLGTVEIRAFVAQPDLAALRLGGGAQVSVDDGRGARRTFPGTVSWISSEAEFAPTPIQTREERADLVYAVKIRVANPDGVLKIGMPADATFDRQGSGR